LVLALTLLVAPFARAVPLETYGRLPHVEDVALSPDGTRLAFVYTNQDARTVAVMSLADHKLVGAVRMRETKLRWISWADNQHVMLYTSATALPWGFTGMEHEWSMLQVYDLASGKIHLVPDPDRVPELSIMNVIAGRVMVRQQGGHTVLYVHGIYVSDVTELALLRVDLQSWTIKLLRRGERATEGWLVDDAGEIVAEQDYSEKQQRWALKVRREGHLQEAVSGKEAIDVPEILGYGPTPDSLLISKLENGDPIWRLLSLKDGTLGPAITEHGVLSEPIEDPHTHRMIGGLQVDDEDESHYLFFDPAMQRHWDAILRAFSGERVYFMSVSEDFQKIVVLVQGSAHGYAYMLVDLSTHRADPIADVYDGITDPFEVRRISYAAQDGLQIPAYLTVPRGKAAKNLPLVLLPHGGPEARDSAGFDWWPQALAAQGYAVLQPNFRGSDLGWKFVSAGFGQWGRKMQTDLSDGVRYLVKEGIVDPARVCIVGASYGGYAALAGVTIDPGVYRCAVSVAGVSDLKRMLSWENEKSRYGTQINVRYWDRFMGVSGANDPALDVISPIKHVDAVQVPVLLIHGKDDTVVPFEQSTVMYDALRHAKKDVEMVTLKHEDHWLSRGETRLQMLQAVVTFLRAHNPPDP
jgi:cephalosporin-C deacetylase-like acetyl esterase